MIFSEIRKTSVPSLPSPPPDRQTHFRSDGAPPENPTYFRACILKTVLRKITYFQSTLQLLPYAKSVSPPSPPHPRSWLFAYTHQSCIFGCSLNAVQNQTPKQNHIISMHSPISTILATQAGRDHFLPPWRGGTLILYVKQF